MGNDDQKVPRICCKFNNEKKFLILEVHHKHRRYQGVGLYQVINQ